MELELTWTEKEKELCCLGAVCFLYCIEVIFE